MSQNFALYECGHARKVTRKGGKLKMKFFAPVSIFNERASEVFGLAPSSRCFILMLYSVDHLFMTRGK